MTGRERFCKTLSFQPVDRLPNMEMGCWGQTWDRWFSEGLPRDSVYMLGSAGEPCLGLDYRSSGGPEAGMIPAFDYQVIEETEHYLVARNPNGIVSKALKDGSAHGTRASMDQFLSFPVTDRASFAELRKRYNPQSPIRRPYNWDELVRMWKGRDYPLQLLGFGAWGGLYNQLRNWVGPESLLYLCCDDPAFIQEMLEFLSDYILATLEPYLGEVEFDYFNFCEDFAFKTGPFVSPEIFRRLFFPHLKRIIDRLRKAGIRHFWLDCDGNPEALIPLLIEAGVTCLWPLEQAAGMDPVRLRKKFGKHLALAGGIDKRELAKDRPAIERELRAKIPPLLETGGYLPHVDHTVPPDISYDNFRYYLDLKRKLSECG
jgi:hypothetical protein